MEESAVRSKFVPVVFCLICAFLALLQKHFRTKKISNDFKIYLNTSLKILCLKGCKRLLLQNQRVRNDLFGCRGY